MDTSAVVDQARRPKELMLKEALHIQLWTQREGGREGGRTVSQVFTHRYTLGTSLQV